MPDLGANTVIIQNLLDRHLAGDESAQEELINQASQRLMVIARKLLRDFGGEARVELWTAEVLAEAYPRLQRALNDVKPVNPAQFFGLARLQMQRALVDRVRAIDGTGKSKRPRKTTVDDALLANAAADDERHRDLIIDLVEAIEKQPEHLAQTTWLKLAGCTHREIGDILGVHHDTIDRYWISACVSLARNLKPFLETR